MSDEIIASAIPFKEEAHKGPHVKSRTTPTRSTPGWHPTSPVSIAQTAEAQADFISFSINSRSIRLARV